MSVCCDGELPDASCAHCHPLRPHLRVRRRFLPVGPPRGGCLRDHHRPQQFLCRHSYDAEGESL